MLSFRNFLVVLILFALSSSCNSADMKKEKRLFIVKGGRSLGAVITDVKDDSLVEEGALILEVIKDSEAEKIGLKKNDIIIEFDGQKVTGAEQLHDLFKDIDEEKEVDIKISRNGQEMDFNGKLKPLKDEQSVNVSIDDEELEVILNDLPDPVRISRLHGLHFMNNKGGFLGVQTDDLSESLQDYFEVDYGVLIKEVIKDSPAEKAGLKAGDVIMKIEGKEIHDFSDLTRSLNYYDPDDEVKIEYSRKGSKKSLKVVLGKKEGFGSGYRFRTFNGPERERLEWIEEDADTLRNKFWKKGLRGNFDFNGNIRIFII